MELEGIALVLQSVAFRESDRIVTLLMADAGKMSVIARGARASRKRFAGSLEPIHTIAVTVDDRGGDLATLKDASIHTPRVALLEALPAVDAAGRALRWARALCPPRTPERAVFASLTGLLDRLDRASASGEDMAAAAPVALARTALELLTATGYGLDLAACVRCGTSCPPARAVTVDANAGGVVCRRCGGGAWLLSAAQRAAVDAALAGVDGALDREDAEGIVRLAEAVMAAHAGVDVVARTPR